jgi:hypothetical protein
MMSENKPAPPTTTTGLDEGTLDEGTIVKFLQLMFLRYQREERESEQLRQLQEAQNGR